jgi:carboxylesterase type B
VPVKEIEQFSGWIPDELDCLNLNLAVPPHSASNSGPYPVMIYIHGGAYWFGGNFVPIYDVANLVSHSIKQDQPVIAVSINYRLGIGGFLASRQIGEELEKDGSAGNGNFALRDQQVALEWIQRYIAQFNGDPDNVTIFGESAGGISVAHQVMAARPAKFRRAIQMSGSLKLTESWPIERHQKRYDWLCQYLGIDPRAADSLDQLRNVSQDELCKATLVIEPSDFTVYNTCDDGYFHRERPSLTYGSALPPWLDSIMIGDTLDEGELWRAVVSKHDLPFYRQRLEMQMSAAEADRVCELYGISAEISREQSIQSLIDMVADMMFKMQNYVIAHQSNVNKTFAYHVDQRSTLDHCLKGQAYHAIDLLYVFLNGKETMSAEQIVLAERMASDWIVFAHGKEPWEPFASNKRWMIYGPEKHQSTWELQSEDQDEPVRRYSRFRALLQDGLYEKLYNAVQDIAHERYRLEGYKPELPN